MALSYGDKSISRFMYDNEIKKMVIEIKQPILDGEDVKFHNREVFAIRQDEYDAATSEFFQKDLSTKDKMETELLAFFDKKKAERAESEKNKVIDPAPIPEG